MLELFGSGYVIDHIIAEHNNRMRNNAYKVYVTDLLKCLAESWGATVDNRYADIIAEPPKDDDKTGDEVALEVIERIGLKPHGFNDTESDTIA